MVVAGIALTVVNVIQKVLLFISLFGWTDDLFPPQASFDDGDRFHYIVVGSGSAGSVIATRLSEDPNVRVLLIEAGGNPPIESDLPGLAPFMKLTKYDWNYTSTRDGTQEMIKNERSYLTRGKMLGGSTSLNFMLYVRGNPADYDSWAETVQDDSWKFENILEYFKKSENLQDETVLDSPTGVYHGTNGYVGVTRLQRDDNQKYLDAFAEIGHDVVLDIGGTDTVGYTQPLLTLADGSRQSTARTFLSASKDRPNLYVAKHTLVIQIVFDENKNATGVIALKRNGQKVMLKALREVIVSAGAINSPQLLMLSGIGPKKHLEDMGIKVVADLPVGENLQDHFATLLLYPTEKASLPSLPNPYDYFASIILGFVAMNKTQTHPIPDYEVTVISIEPEYMLVFCTYNLQFKDEICERFYEMFKGKQGIGVVLHPLRPKSRGRILLRSANPLEYPLISLGIYSDKSDLDNMITYVQDFDRITGSTLFKRFNSTAIMPLQCEGLEKGSRALWDCYVNMIVTTYWHYAGTCAMGSVVDSQLYVIGTKRLRVADASIMPVITSGNLNAPTMMIGEKAAEMIKRANA